MDFGEAMFTLTSEGRLAGRFHFDAVQTEGPNIGTEINGQATFSATCVGECPTPQDPPGGR